jgi:ribonuclease BN (tRNA processing enzyme)
MELVILGTGGGWALPGRAACGYLVRHEGFTLWLDAGTGTMANLQKHVGLTDVDAVMVSHRHFDHFLDVYPFFLARWLHPAPLPKVPLFLPPGTYEHVAQLEAGLGQVFAPEAVELGGSVTIGPFRVRTAAMAHPVPTLGVRIEADGAALAYSADSGPNERLVELANGADVLLCEATWLRRPEGVPMDLHMTAAETGEHAARARVGSLVLTHIWPAIDRADALAEASGTNAGSETRVAEEGLVIVL